MQRIFDVIFSGIALVLLSPLLLPLMFILRLTGEGEMFNSDNSNHDDAQDQIKLLDDEIAALKKEIERKNRVIDKLT